MNSDTILRRPDKNWIKSGNCYHTPSRQGSFRRRFRACRRSYMHQRAARAWCRSGSSRDRGLRKGDVAAC
ncbi:MAG: hypothetical protein QMC09_14365, partial [Thauera sp.]